jgi:hypothetical protein
MTFLTVFTFLNAVGIASMAHADESMSEKANAKMHDAKRSVKKGVHRAEEAVCAENDAKCLAKKAKHRAEEGSDYVKDKAKETKNSVDSNSDANK